MARLATGNTGSILGDFNEYGSVIKLVRGDALGEVTFTLKDSNKAATGKTLDSSDPDTWAPLDLTDATVFLKLRPEGSTTVKTTILLYVAEPFNEGKVFFAWTPEALDTAGMFTGEIEINYANSKVLTVYKELRLQIREDY